MRNVSAVTALLILIVPALGHADCLDDAQRFAIGLCGDLERSGMKISASSSVQANADLSNIIKKFIDVSGKGDVAGAIDKYEGPAREELVKDRFDARSCRQNMATRAIDLQCQKKVSFKTCPRPEFGRVGWEGSADREGSSGWRGGGHTQDEWCGELAAAAFRENGAGAVHDWHVISKGEDKKKDFLGHVSYNYKCKVHIDYSPIYRKLADPLCGIDTVSN